MLEAVALTIMGAWLVVLGGGFFFRHYVDRASSILLVIAGAYAILWQEPTLLGYAGDEVFHVGLAQPVFLLFLSAAVFLWAYWLFQQHVEMLETVTEDLSEALTLEKTLLDILSHDLRNPLTVVHTRLAAVASGRSSYEEQAEPIQDSLLRAERIIDNSLVYSRLTTDGELETEPIDLRELAESALDGFELEAELNGVKLELDAPELVEAEVTPLLQHAFENLLDNAIKYSPAGEPVRLGVDSHDGFARVWVEDRGPGLARGDQERLLHRFERDRMGDEEGSGLGLAIVRRLTEAHDGTVRIEKNEHGGATVTLWLPRDADPVTDADDLSLPPKATLPPGGPP